MRFARTITAAVAMLAPAFAAQAGITSNFGMRSDPFHRGMRMHAGMDMAGRSGDPIYATGDGYVRRARWAGGYGNLVEIDHGFGYQTRFGHLTRSLVSEGQFVRRGQMIALMGSTGRSTGPHLHYEVRIGGRPVQPARFMQIFFSSQPDWGAVRMSLAQVPAPNRTASIAMARAVPRQRLAQADEGRRAASEIFYGSSGTGRDQPIRASISFADGHSSYGTP